MSDGRPEKESAAAAGGRASCASSSQAAFGCVECGCADDHDDVVGAINILARGYPHRAHTDCTECVRSTCRMSSLLQLQPANVA
ncbi:hypothetical protein C6P77_24735 [Burkholderia ambifaria]|nr:hypothetical protein C6P77_24735 [Burkholderia ambifaria]